MTLSKSFIKNAVTTPLDARLMNMASLVANSDGSPRVGVLGNANTAIVSTLATMNVAVAAAEFATSKGKADGVAIFTNDGTTNVPISAAPGSNSRITVIWVKHFDDTTGDTTGQFLPLFGTTDGAAAASPTKPAIPTGALELATLQVFAGTTASNGGANVLTNTYQMTAARGGIVPFRTKADLDLWTNPVVGQRAYVTTTEVDYKRLSSGPRWEKLTDSWFVRRGTTTVLTGSTMTSACSLTLTNAPAGRYIVHAVPVTWAAIATLHFRRVMWGATQLAGGTDGITPAASADTAFPLVAQVDHTGGTVVVDLLVQVNHTTSSMHAACSLLVEYLGEA